MLVVLFALWAAAGSFMILSGRVVPADLDSWAGRIIILLSVWAIAVCPVALVGWKAIQLSIGRGRATRSLWTLSWLAFFGLAFIPTIIGAFGAAR